MQSCSSRHFSQINGETSYTRIKSLVIYCSMPLWVMSALFRMVSSVSKPCSMLIFQREALFATMQITTSTIAFGRLLYQKFGASGWSSFRLSLSHNFKCPLSVCACTWWCTHQTPLQIMQATKGLYCSAMPWALLTSPQCPLFISLASMPFLFPCLFRSGVTNHGTHMWHQSAITRPKSSTTHEDLKGK